MRKVLLFFLAAMVSGTIISRTISSRNDGKGKKLIKAAEKPLAKSFYPFVKANSYASPLAAAAATNLENVAAEATPSTDLVSGWEKLEAVNDGFDPANSGDRTNTVYGNWPSSNVARWVQYEWASPVTLVGTDIYWFTDDGGILLPTEAYIEYFNATTSAWAKIGDIGKDRDKYNHLDFSAVTTTKLRVTMKNNLESTGIIEWKAYAAPVNIAPRGAATTSYVSGWEKLEAINDGFEPANSGDRANTVYGNWPSPNTLRWVQYEWSSPAKITGTEVYWFTDDGGIKLPTEAFIEYYDALTDSWIKAGDIGKERDKYNSLSISSVTTTKLRISMKNDTESTGIIEWKVFGKISSVGTKTVYIPNEWKTSPLKEQIDLANRSLASENFVVVWGPLAGNDPTKATNPDIVFKPQAVLDSMEVLYKFMINDQKFVEEIGNLKKYKTIVVMNNTWNQDRYTGWAFGGGFDNVINAMYIDPRTVRENAWVLAHEITHAFQYMIPLLYPGAGFTGVNHSGFFWETHANFMAIQRYPNLLGNTDYPRAWNFTNYHFGSARKHYSDFYLLQYLKDKYGIEFVNRIWRESNPSAKEHPTETIGRLLNLDQSKMNDMMLEYAMKRVKGDFSNKAEIKKLESSIDQFWDFRKTVILDSIGNGQYAIPNNLAPQQYGFNIVRLHVQQGLSNCVDNYVNLKFKGHSNVNAFAGWRYGFVSVDDAGNSTYGAIQAGDAEIAYKVPANSAELYLVVLGAPSSYQKHTDLFEAGFPRLYRFPYEISLQGAVPEGYQPQFRQANLPAGSRHRNGGGFVASTASVASSVFVAPTATVLGRAQLSGNVRVEGKAMIRDDASVSGNAVIKDFAVVSGNSKISGNATISKYGYVHNTIVKDNASVSENAAMFWSNITGSAKIYGNAFSPNSQNLGGTIEIGGDAEIGGTCSAGRYLQSSGIMFSPTSTPRTECDGLVNHELNNDINNQVTLFTASEMAFSKFLMCGADAGNLPERTITFPAVTAKRFGEPTFNLGVSSSSNETISYSSSNPKIAEVDQTGKVTIKGVGDVKITAITPINSAYRNRALAERVLTINKGVQSISAVAPGVLKLQDGSAKLMAASTVNLPLSFEVNNGWVAWLDGSTLMFKQSGTTDVTIRQSGSDLYDAATPVKFSVTIEDTANGLVQVNKAISPNNDGINDYFNIRGIDLYAENSVSILSSNGVEVYKADRYDNSRILFDGRTTEGARLPAGTYFYVIKIKDKDGAWKVMKGYFALGY